MKRQDKYPETKWFVFDNPNPKKKLTEDCYVRALTIGLEKEYKDVLQLLFDSCIKTGYSIGSKKNIEKVLESLGYGRNSQPKHADGTKYTGKQFCETFRKGTYICNIGGHHITVIVDGKIHDTWDCSNKCIGNYWKIK